MVLFVQFTWCLFHRTSIVGFKILIEFVGWQISKLKSTRIAVERCCVVAVDIDTSQLLFHFFQFVSCLVLRHNHYNQTIQLLFGKRVGVFECERVAVYDIVIVEVLRFINWIWFGLFQHRSKCRNRCFCWIVRICFGLIDMVANMIADMIGHMIYVDGVATAIIVTITIIIRLIILNWVFCITVNKANVIANRWHCTRHIIQIFDNCIILIGLRWLWLLLLLWRWWRVSPYRHRFRRWCWRSKRLWWLLLNWLLRRLLGSWWRFINDFVIQTWRMLSNHTFEFTLHRWAVRITIYNR